jgi:hypothetical protein
MPGQLDTNVCLADVERERVFSLLWDLLLMPVAFCVVFFSVVILHAVCYRR